MMIHSVPAFDPLRPPLHAPSFRRGTGVALLYAIGCAAAHSLLAQSPVAHGPASKIYVAEIDGEAVVEKAAKIEPLNSKASYIAEGSSFETKAKSSDAMVFSNGSAIYLDADTRIETRRFAQEPFTPNRADLELEPSVSKTQIYLARGIVALCTSRSVAGSIMIYQTPLGSINVRGRKLVIETTDQVTRVSMIEGDSTVRAGDNDQSGHVVHRGEQAVLQPGPAGQPNAMEIHQMTEAEIGPLSEKVEFACMAKRTVFFDVTEGTSETGEPGPQITPQATVPLTVPPANVVSPSTLDED